MANDSTVFVGRDVHKDSIVAAYSVGFSEVVEALGAGFRYFGFPADTPAPRVQASDVPGLSAGYPVPKPNNRNPAL